jgi:Tol biopolymer transport system component
MLSPARPRGGGKKQLTDNSTNDFDPSYSPSGKKIAYAGDDGNDYEIYTINPGGGGRQLVTDNANNDRDPYWGSQ